MQQQRQHRLSLPWHMTQHQQQRQMLLLLLLQLLQLLQLRLLHQHQLIG
jgi:hypothetical protein